jgi:hypothetical protein
VARRHRLLTAAAVGTIAAANAALSLRRGVYDLRRGTGVAAFALDSTWNLVGTTTALAVHTVNALLPVSGYNDALSRGATYHVYDRGMTVRPRYAFAFGNVVTNARGRRDLVARHEAVHVWQQRAFGPLFPVLYGGWMVGGALVGTAVWLRHRHEPWFALVETAAYYDNPFEYWAYRRQGVWPPRRAHPLLAWPADRNSVAPVG